MPRFLRRSPGTAARHFVITIVAAFSVCAAEAQLRVVKDINTKQSPVGSSINGFNTIGNMTLFFANQDDTGNELWKTDGTEAGTVLVRDITPGPASGVPTGRSGAPVIGNRILFVASDGVHGFEPWASDGTSEGTVMLADINPGSANTNVGFGRLVGSTEYFVANNPSTGTELWRTDGTPGGTRMVIDLNPGPASSNFQALGVVDSLLVFRASDGVNAGIFTTDGTASGTHFVTRLATPTLSTTLGNQILFTIPSGTGKFDLMKTDGTESGTVLVRSGFITTATDSTIFFRVIDGFAYFLANDGISGNELWRTDGTTGGTGLVVDLAPGPANLPIVDLSIVNGLLLITEDGPTRRMWSSDGTAAGTRLVKIVPGAVPRLVTATRLYFGWDDGIHGHELWSTDGTSDGTVLVADINPGPAGSNPAALFARPNGLFLTADNGINGTEPWISDGTPGGTRMLKNLHPEEQLGSGAAALANVGGRIFFRASDGTSPSIWMTDGSTAGTVRLDVEGTGGGSAVASNGLYYFVRGDLPALELWRTDGTAAGTFRLFTMSESRFFAALVPFKGGLFFQGSDSAHGAEPWFTDGTVGGTRMIADIEPGPSGSFGYASGTVVGDRVYFPADGPEGTQPWVTDGTAAGTHRLVTGVALDQSTSPQAFTGVGNFVFFAAYLHDSAFNLLRTNIASGETSLVRHFEDRAPGRMWNAGGSLMFTLRNELWRSDGTEAGTTKVLGSIPTPLTYCDNGKDFAVAGGVLYWYAFTLEDVPELWRSDGTATGTFRLGSFPGPFAESLQTCLAHYLYSAGGHLYFIGRDAVHGAEPWVSDGTVAGTHLLWDVNPGLASSDPAEFLILGGSLYFTATTQTTGRELWAFDLASSRRRPSRP